MDLRSVTVSEASELSGIPRRTLDELCKRGVIPSVLPHGAKRGRRIRLEVLESYVARLEEESTQKEAPPTITPASCVDGQNERLKQVLKGA